MMGSYEEVLMDLSESDREDSLNLLMNTLGSSFSKNEIS